MSSRRTPQERRIDELLERLIPGDMLLVTELSRLGRSTGQVIHLIDELVKRSIRVVILSRIWCWMPQAMICMPSR